ncbi:hypothetical protein [Bradyrhizobium sp. CCBAU 53415]|uniref:hypothetical protein n=1 Tax=Bradyrhizobium sp. CCBAU 53415 TaxID=1325119 RepID=UPI0023060BC5|nr:hypothetical protein [Bradyrhizobium sp. CCBAU 53415]
MLKLEPSPWPALALAGMRLFDPDAALPVVAGEMVCESAVAELPGLLPEPGAEEFTALFEPSADVAAVSAVGLGAALELFVEVWLGAALLEDVVPVSDPLSAVDEFSRLQPTSTVLADSIAASRSVLLIMSSSRTGGV